MVDKEKKQYLNTCYEKAILINDYWKNICKSDIESKKCIESWIDQQDPNYRNLDIYKSWCCDNQHDIDEDNKRYARNTAATKNFINEYNRTKLTTESF